MADDKAGILKEALRRVRQKSRLNDPKGQKYDGKPDSKTITDDDTDDAMDQLDKASEEKRKKQ